MIIRLSIIIPIIVVALLIFSSIRDHVHKESYYYAGGTYLCKQDKQNGV